MKVSGWLKYFRKAAFVAAMVAVYPGAGGRAAEASDFFEKQVQPILRERCYECHSHEANKVKGGLTLDSRSGWEKGGDTGPAIVPGKPDESLLVKAIAYGDPDLQMPPKKKLGDTEIAVLTDWVKRGAPDPRVLTARKGTDLEEGRKHWAFQPLAKTTPPALPKKGWGRNAIDGFVAAKLSEAGLTPAAEADRSELVRRVYFDLVGLPPTPEEARAFVQSKDPHAYEKLLDTLLASPRYGERWAQHWLDLVRFAESDGYNQDAFRPGAWPYRDWVIKSLNADMPYDRFVQYQLAGDELAPGDLTIQPATSFLRNTIYEYNLRDVRGQWDAILNDITDVAGEAFLGLSFSCARCHNHKFDPILQTDYFSLRAFFEPLLWRTDLTLADQKARAEYAIRQAAWEGATKEVRAQIYEMVGKKIEDAVATDRKRFPDDIQAMVKTPLENRGPLERQLAMMAERMPAYIKEDAESKAIKYLKTDADKKRYAALQEELKKFDHLKPKPLVEAFVATDVGPASPPTQVKSRRGELEVQPAFLTVLHAGAPEIRPLPNSTGRRTALAQWITRADNPLATRVIVNRVWQYHFGRGLAGNPSDFGNLGEKPTHPELLDWLAGQFVADGWSFKKLHKLILQSATYRQTARRPMPAAAAKLDPANKLWWRFSPQRLDAEQVRDAMLVVSGELDLAMGGMSGDANSSLRRTIYTTKKRNSPNDLLRSFDAPAGFLSSSERQRTTTPSQALLLLNGDWPLERARKVAARVDSVPDAWQRILGRPPTAAEAAQAEAFLGRMTRDEFAMDVAATGTNVVAGRFRPDSLRERLQVNRNDREGEDFSVEAVVTVENYAAGEGFRTIVSRWNGGRSAVESCGWSLGVAGLGSREKGGTLVLRMVGVDANDAFAFESVPSGLKLATNTAYYVAAYLSSSDHTVTFRAKPLRDATATMQTATVKHLPLDRISAGRSPLMIGGIAEHKQDLFEGQIETVRVSVGPFPSDAPTAWETWQPTMFLWNSRQTGGEQLAWLGLPPKTGTQDRRRQALADLCHVLMNSNEFIYLH
jgi:hypothetical protein